MEPTDILRELFEEASPDDTRDPELKRRVRSSVAASRARLAVERLESRGFAIVRNRHEPRASNEDDEYPLTHSRIWG